MTRIWECVYTNDQRRARHRCRACMKIIQPGQRVLMVRVAKATVAIHLEHADQPVMPDRAGTWRQSFDAWAAP